jgi:hypothetical protein
MAMQSFFGDDWEEALDSLKSAPGALGGIMLSALRQVRPVDVAAFSLVVIGWAWAIGGHLVAGQGSAPLLALALLPTFLWLAAGAAGAVIFEVGGLGVRSLAYWESYVLILVFALFGSVSLRLAVAPGGRVVYPPPGPGEP